MITEAQRDALASALVGAPRKVYDFLAVNHWRTEADVVIGARVQPAEARGALSALEKHGLLEQVAGKRGVLWRPAPCTIEERVKPGPPPDPEPTSWYESELEAALKDKGHALHASAVVFVRRLLSGVSQDVLDEIDDGDPVPDAAKPL